MRIIDILWLPDIVEKLAVKHDVQPLEVEEVLQGRPGFRRIERGKVQGEDLYTAMGQTDAGRYLIVYFIRKAGGVALIISARDMDSRERRQYGRKLDKRPDSRRIRRHRSCGRVLGYTQSSRLLGPDGGSPF